MSMAPLSTSILPPDLGRRWRQARFNPIRNLSPESLARALDQFDAGYLRTAALLWETIEDRDDVLQIVGPKRRKRVSRRPWSILTTDDSAAAKAHAQTLQDFFNNLTVTEAADENVKGGLRLLIRQMMNAAFHKYAVHEIVWSSTGGKLRAELRFVPLYFFSNVSGKLGYIGPEGAGYEGLPLPDDEWMTTSGDSALMKAASICYIFKKLSLADWLNFSEKFGIPGIHGETQAAKGSQEFEDFVEALDTFANDWVTATNAGAKINLVEVKQNGDGPFGPMVERMDRRLASLVVGADLGTMSRESAVGSQPQQDDADQLLEDDCELISETLQTNLSRAVIRFVYGPTVEPLAYISIAPPVQSDVKSDLAVDQFLLDNGGELDAAATFERYERQPAKSMPQGATLKAPAQPAAGPAAPAATAAPAMAANDAAADPHAFDAANPELLRNALARAIGAQPKMLAPVAAALRELQRQAESGHITDAALLETTAHLANQMPEFFSRDSFAPLADEMEAAMGTAVVNGVVAAFRRHPVLAKANP